MPRRKREAKIEDVKERHENELLRLGALLVAIGRKKRKPCILVLVKQVSSKTVEAIPKEIEGFEVCVEEADEFKALSP
jgi:hypothetical protein